MDVIFKKGIPGFDSLREFTIKDLEGNEKFKILESRESEISFVTTNPFEIYSDYEVDLNDETIKELDIKRPEDVVILSIITLGRTF